MKKIILSLLIVILMMPASTVLALESENKGIDVSRHNGSVDWFKVSEQGFHFAMIKTGNGKAPVGEETIYDRDPEFENNYQGAGEYGIKRGVYHVASNYSVEGAALDAEYCLEILNGRELEYPVAYDLEQDAAQKRDKVLLTDMVITFCDVISEAGYTPMIYTSSKIYEEYLDMDQLSAYKIWVAHHGVEEPKYNGKFDIWQYSSTEKVDGANTNNGKGTCDLNYSFMEAEDLSVSTKSLVLGKGETFQLKTELFPAETTDTVVYSSSKKAVATVSKTGKIIAKGVGSTVITIKTKSGITKTCKVTVKKAPTSIKVATTNKSLKVKGKYQIKPKLSSGSVSNKITYSSSNKSIASVSTKGLVTAKQKGKCIITVKTFNNKSVKINIKVN